MIDADPQSNATSAAGIPKNSESSLYEYFEEADPGGLYKRMLRGYKIFPANSNLVAQKRLLKTLTKEKSFFQATLK